MLQTDLTFFAFAAPAVVFAGISKGGFGSGAAFASASILALIVTPGQALALMLPLLMLIDIASLKPYWGKWNWPASRFLILTGVPGVFLGSVLFQTVNDEILRILIGAIALGFVAWHASGGSYVRNRAIRSGNLISGAGLGVLAGFSSFISHAGGPPAAVFLLSRGLGKTEYQASTVLIFWVLNIVKCVAYTWLGLFSLTMIWANVLLAPFALLGTWIGVRLHNFMPERTFFRITYVLLTVTGLKLIWDSLS